MNSPNSNGKPDYEDFTQGLQAAFEETRLHSPQGVSGVEERLRGKLAARGITLTPDVLRALAYALVNDRGADALHKDDDGVRVAADLNR